MAQLTLNQTTLLGATTGTIESLLLPLEVKPWLLPSSAVAEVVDDAQCQAAEGKPDWFVGRLSWRDMDIPVLSVEVMNGQALPRDQGRVAVLSGISRQGELPYYGVLLSALPRPARVKIAELEDLEGAPLGPVDYLQVRYAGELACIPDLDKLEALLVSV